MKNLAYREIAQGIGELSIHRPDALNALNQEVMTELAEFLNDPPRLRCLVITGAGQKAFVAGADIKEFQTLDAARALRLAQNGQAVFQSINELPFPVIAKINGFALGGGFELALACDVMIAKTDAYVGLPEVYLGLIPGYGGTQRLAKSVGLMRARLMAMSAEKFKASDIKDWGLFAAVVSAEELDQVTLQWAEKLARCAPLAQVRARRALELAFEVEISRGLDMEAQMFADSFATNDFVEGVNAFVAKRTPQFTGS